MARDAPFPTVCGCYGGASRQHPEEPRYGLGTATSRALRGCRRRPAAPGCRHGGGLSQRELTRHPPAPSWLTLAERKRAQSLPDGTHLFGSLAEKGLQVGAWGTAGAGRQGRQALGTPPRTRPP